MEKHLDNEQLGRRSQKLESIFLPDEVDLVKRTLLVNMLEDRNSYTFLTFQDYLNEFNNTANFKEAEIEIKHRNLLKNLVYAAVSDIFQTSFDIRQKFSINVNNIHEYLVTTEGRKVTEIILLTVFEEASKRLSSKYSAQIKGALQVSDDKKFDLGLFAQEAVKRSDIRSLLEMYLRRYISCLSMFFSSDILELPDDQKLKHLQLLNQNLSEINSQDDLTKKLIEKFYSRVENRPLVFILDYYKGGREEARKYLQAIISSNLHEEVSRVYERVLEMKVQKDIEEESEELVTGPGDENWEDNVSELEEISEKDLPLRGSIKIKGSQDDAEKTSSASGMIDGGPVKVVMPQLPSVDITNKQIEPRLPVLPKAASDRKIRGMSPLKLTASVLAAIVGVLGTYILFRSSQKSQSVNKPSIQLAQKVVLQDPAIEQIQDAQVVAQIRVIDAQVSTPKQDIKPKEYKPTQTTIKLDLSPKLEDSKNLIAIKGSSLQSLPEGNFRKMFEGEGFVVQSATEGSITGFMQDVLLEIVKKSPNKKEAIKAYESNLRDLEKGWLIYMENQATELAKKPIENRTEKEKQLLQYWAKYKRTHLDNGFNARYWLNKLNKAKPGTTEYLYYKNLSEKGSELMQGLEELNPDILDVNSPGGSLIYYTKTGKDGKKHVLKTFWDFATKMKLPIPEKDLSTTGDITPTKTVNQTTVAEKSTAKTMDFLDKMNAEIEQRAFERSLDTRNSWVSGEIVTNNVSKIQPAPTLTPSVIVDMPVDNSDKPSRSQSGLIDNSKGIVNNISRSQAGVINIDKPKSNLSRVQSGEIIMDFSKNNLSKTQSGEIYVNTTKITPVKVQSGLIDNKQIVSKTQAGVITVNSSNFNLSRTQSGEIIASNQVEEKPKSVWSKAKDTFKSGAKKLWGKLFG